ncbi:MAG: lipoate--protein ligase family protein [Anaerolineales bacterium]|nr:lipoate--protein ligase family protein [Anaerolineales bacterium]
MDIWRLVYDPPRDGASNMAVDEALLEETAAGRSLPTLRLYAWEPPTLSLGFAQPAADVNREALQRLGWGLVRRPTGGRAILHTDELTYSITAPESHPLMRGGVLESYRRLSLGLLSGLRRLGADVRADSGGRARASGNPVCFEIPSKYEISSGWRKLIGSAQARRLGGVLQHGALPLGGDLSRILQVLAKAETTPERIRRRAATLGELLGREVSWREAADAVARGFAETFEIEFQRGELSESEKTRADELANEKYGTAGWTNRV